MKDKNKQIINKIRRVVREELAGKVPDYKQWFRIEETATIFGVSDATIRNWIDSGVFDARTINTGALDKAKRIHVRVTRESIVKLLNDKNRQAM